MQTEATTSANSGAAANKPTPDLSTLNQLSDSKPALDQRSPDNRTNLLAPSNYSSLEVIKRNGTPVPFDPQKIYAAMSMAFLSETGEDAERSVSVHNKIAGFTNKITTELLRRADTFRQIHIEDIQDRVELTLMYAGEQKIARHYVLYREARAQERSSSQRDQVEYNILRPDGSSYKLSSAKLTALYREASTKLSDIDLEMLRKNSERHLASQIKEADFYDGLLLAVTPNIEHDPGYAKVAARILMQKLWLEVGQCLELEAPQSPTQKRKAYGQFFIEAILFGLRSKQFNKELANFDLRRLAKEIKPERDDLFIYQGARIVYDRYLQHQGSFRYELPQVFFMRVAMGLALKEQDRDARAIEFYRQLSSFDYMSSTPTLFNSGTSHSQLSSCYISTVADDLESIFTIIQDNALLSKWAGGLGNDWTPIRANGALIRGTNGKSNGVLPFLKVANSTTHAVNQGGKRNGALCAYLELWHRDIDYFIEQRKNTGDERLRNHDMNIATWIPDLFMQRVMQKGQWTLFSPDEVPDLHDLYGRAFKERYEHYERQAAAGKIKLVKTVDADTLWKSILIMLFQTGHPWITFKDPCNIRSPQRHAGVVHSSNLCTEITLNTSSEETAVCNLGSINLAQHVNDQGIDHKKLRQTVRTAIRMLDNVIDINYYPIEKARASNFKHRPIGLGVMGYQDALFKLDLAFDSEQALDFTDKMQEAISYYAIEASSDLAAERGAYQSYEGSLWSQDVFPIDSLKLLASERDSGELDVDYSCAMDWQPLRAKVKKQGMRNSNVMAIAPTATIAKIIGVYSSIEPMHANLYVETHKSGDFYVINDKLVQDLKGLGLWDKSITHDLKYEQGSIQNLAAIPEHLRRKHKTSFEIDMKWVIAAASRRQKWIDQAQSVNLFFPEPDGDYIDATYKAAWRQGLKTTYYLRSKAASKVEQSTTKGGQRRSVQANRAGAVASSRATS